MRILVTGARGKVGAATVAALVDAGHEVTATDLSRPRFEGDRDAIPYKQADLTAAGDAYAIVPGHDAVVHAAAIPDPISTPPHVVFQNNLMALFNTLEAAVRAGVPRFVNLSSETVPGFIFAERPFLPDYVPVDEQHPVRPQDPYAIAKHFGEQLLDAAVRRADVSAVSIRPSWVQWEGNYELNIGPWLREPTAVRGLLDLRRRLRPRRRDPACGRGGDARPRGRLRRLAGHRLARAPGRRWRTASTARRRRRSGRRTSRARTASRSRRRAGCSATTRAARGGTTSTTAAACARRRASGSSAARPASSGAAG